MVWQRILHFLISPSHTTKNKAITMLRTKQFGSSLHNISKKRQAEMASGAWKPTPRKPLRQMSKKMKSRTTNWRKTAKEICTVDGILYCPLCCKPITDNYVAHHYKERRGQAHNIDNDKYVVALHPWCHNNIDHYSDDFYIARTKIETILKKWRKL